MSARIRRQNREDRGTDEIYPAEWRTLRKSTPFLRLCFVCLNV